jgi:hypothetical protein
MTRISLIRSPVQACLLGLAIRSSPFLQTIELIDVGAGLGEEGRLIDLLKLQSETLQFLAIKLNHQPEAAGLLDTVLEVSGYDSKRTKERARYWISLRLTCHFQLRYVQTLKYFMFNTTCYPLASLLKSYQETYVYSSSELQTDRQRLFKDDLLSANSGIAQLIVGQYLRSIETTRESYNRMSR